MNITRERVDSLLKGYRKERPTLTVLLEQELSKEMPSRSTLKRWIRNCLCIPLWLNQ